MVQGAFWLFLAPSPEDQKNVCSPPWKIKADANVPFAKETCTYLHLKNILNLNIEQYKLSSIVLGY